MTGRAWAGSPRPTIQDGGATYPRLPSLLLQISLINPLRVRIELRHGGQFGPHTRPGQHLGDFRGMSREEQGGVAFLALAFHDGLDGGCELA